VLLEHLPATATGKVLKAQLRQMAAGRALRARRDDRGRPWRQEEVAAMFARYGPGYRWWAVVTVMLGTVAAVMEATIANVAMPEIIRVFEIGHDRVQLLSTGFLAATTASMLLSQWAIAASAYAPPTSLRFPC